MAQPPLIAHDVPLLDLPNREGMRVLVVGNEPVMSSVEYDPAQLWFPFMGGMMFLARIPVDSPVNPRAAAKAASGKFAAVPRRCQRLYVYERDVPQYVLPFEEMRAVSNKHRILLEEANWPTWDRDPEGNLLRTLVRDDLLTEADETVKDWCRDNLSGRFHATRRAVTCALEIDAVQVRLMFG